MLVLGYSGWLVLHFTTKLVVYSEAHNLSILTMYGNMAIDRGRIKIWALKNSNVMRLCFT